MPASSRSIVFTALFLAAGFTTGAAPAAPPTETEARELTQLHEAWAQARVAGDVAFLERFYAKEFRITNAGGRVVSREEDIALFAERAIKPDYIRDDDLAISRYGETALVTGVESLKGTYKGVPGEMALRFVNVLVRRDGRWQLVMHQSTEVRKRP